MTNEELTSRYMELDERVTRHTEQIKTAFNQITELKCRFVNHLGHDRKKELLWEEATSKGA